MNSRLQRKLTYLRDRLVNAYWMVREGRFRQVYDSLLLELRTRRDQVGAAMVSPETPVQQAGGRNPCKPVTPSSRPTTNVEAPARPDIVLDEVALTLRELLATRGRAGTTPGEHVPGEHVLGEQVP